MYSRGLMASGWAIVLAVSSAVPARADHKVYSPYVEQGVLELEMRGHRSFDRSSDKDNQQTQVYEVGYGVNSWWSTSLFGRVTKEPGADFRYSATAWENIFQLTERGQYPVDVGLYAEYRKSHLSSEPDELETKLLLQRDVGPFAVTANLIFNREIGRGSGKGIGFEYAARANYPWKRELQFNVEAFGEPGRLTGFKEGPEQEHVLGPVLSGKFNIANLPGNFVYEAGYLLGLTSGSPQGTVKWLLEYEVPF
ncbi:MAG: hypothetical protein JWL84_2588 [Rhodospirillales bacterium]|jgi:hypothetical protein|nr:hypothetical protein [Rhodospirillales bacterium]